MQPSLALNYCIATTGLYPAPLPPPLKRHLVAVIGENLEGEHDASTRRHLQESRRLLDEIDPAKLKVRLLVGGRILVEQARDIYSPSVTPYLGEIRIFAGDYVPPDWLPCDGSTLNVAAAELLHTLLRTTYGGDSMNTFALPDLRGAVPIGVGTGVGLRGFMLGEAAGADSVTLSEREIPRHNHTLNAIQSRADNTDPDGRLLATPSPAARAYAPPFRTTGKTHALAPGSLAPSKTASVGAHDNSMPSVALNYMIATYGLYPDSLSDAPVGGPYCGEIRAVAFDKAPDGWATCDGQPSPNRDLFSVVVGEHFGGDTRHCRVPNLQGRVVSGVGTTPIAQNKDPVPPGRTARALGKTYGSASVVLDQSQVPSHSHEVVVAQIQGADQVADPGGNYLGYSGAPEAKSYASGTTSAANLGTLNALAVSTVGSSTLPPHENRQPYVVLNYIICVEGGAYPARP